MSITRFERRDAVRLAELAAFIAIWLFVMATARSVAAILHLPLPEMPLIRHAYILFAAIVLACLWVRWRGESLATFGLIVPRRWLLYIGQGLLILIAQLTYDIALRPFIDPVIAGLTHANPTQAEQHFAILKGNLNLALFLVPFAWIFGGFGEEMLNRGLIMTRAAQVLGEGRWAWTAALILQALVFALGHAYQGPVGMFSVFVAGLISGAGTLIWGRNLWPAIIAHGLLDSIAFLAMYAGVAHA